MEKLFVNDNIVSHDEGAEEEPSVGGGLGGVDVEGEIEQKSRTDCRWSLGALRERVLTLVP